MIQTISRFKVVSQVTGNITSDMAGEKVMLSITNGKYYNLGEVGGDIWDLIKEPISVSEIIDIMVTKYEVDIKDCEQQVLQFLEQLLKEELIKMEDY
ncbi:lasso peptide biosynthesis PqqD family chaperone [Ornithinibacillus californiensis]|uniref:lasso peptide biosynthesis PqqD family chaperone n=1 Tax=Ornithinibacillus californiensis TaxID=161536 RepID=UPI00064DFA33|nr:lasso peptide biosynthesis PqqD family chaperone [Ornithinibacillus californiensis]